MEIKVGKYTICSDAFCMWINEEYDIKKKDGSVKQGERKIAGYARNADILLRQFTEHKHRANEAATVEELVRLMKQVAEDTIMLKEAMVKSDLKLMRKVGKKVKEINK